MANATTGYIRVVEFTARFAGPLQAGRRRAREDRRHALRDRPARHGARRPRRRHRRGAAVRARRGDARAIARRRRTTSKEIVAAQADRRRDHRAGRAARRSGHSRRRGGVCRRARRQQSRRPRRRADASAAPRASSSSSCPTAAACCSSTVRYLTPASAAIHEKGLTPDVHVEHRTSSSAPSHRPATPTLDKALERISQPQPHEAGRVERSRLERRTISNDPNDPNDLRIDSHDWRV